MDYSSTKTTEKESKIELLQSDNRGSLCSGSVVSSSAYIEVNFQQFVAKATVVERYTKNVNKANKPVTEGVKCRRGRRRR